MLTRKSIGKSNELREPFWKWCDSTVS